VQVLPDADDPLIHIYAEGNEPDDSAALEAELHALVSEVLDAEEVETSTRG
jgi:phosphomannomutase